MIKHKENTQLSISTHAQLTMWQHAATSPVFNIRRFKKCCC